MGTKPYDTRTVWSGFFKPHFSSLDSDLHTEVCIIGAGIAGLSTAYQLLKAGVDVVVIDREPLGYGETGLTSAHLSSVFDEGFRSLIEMHDPEIVRKAYHSHVQAIDTIENICIKEEFDCDFKRVSGYSYRSGNLSAEDLKQEFECAKYAGVANPELLTTTPTSLLRHSSCIKYADQAQFHPIKYLSGLAEAVVRMGGKIMTHTAAHEVIGGKSPYVKIQNDRKITCHKIVVTTHSPIHSSLGIHTKMGSYRTYVVGLRVPQIHHDSFLLWDSEDPYHYLRFAFDEAREETLLLLGGEDHRTGQDISPDEHFKKLIGWGRKSLTCEFEVATKWSGQIQEPVDGLAFIGKSPGDENILFATGFSGQGMTYGTTSGSLIRDLIIEHKNSLEEVFSPDRVTLNALSHFIQENTSSTLPYTDWISGGDVQSLDEILPGEGAVYRNGLEKCAVYRDTMGELSVCSAVCPHMGGLVRWNAAEKSWDCPCHGSRFDQYGHVINGPALEALKPIRPDVIPVPQEVEDYPPAKPPFLQSNPQTNPSTAN